VSRLDEAVERLEVITQRVQTGIPQRKNSEAIALVLRALSLHRAECREWRRWADDGDFVWKAQEARAATEALMAEMETPDENRLKGPQT